MYLAHIFKHSTIKQVPFKVSSVCFVQNNNETNNCINLTPKNPNLILRKNFSLKSAIESIVTTQAGIIRSISESTPVSYVQDFVVNFHSFTELPWWGSIVLTTILMRTLVTFPLGIHQNYIMAKIENLKLEMPKIVEEMKKEMAVAVKNFGWTEQQAKVIYFRSVR